MLMLEGCMEKAWRFLGDCPAVFYPDTRLFEMPEERSVDIDSEIDFTLVELLLRKQQGTPS